MTTKINNNVEYDYEEDSTENDNTNLLMNFIELAENEKVIYNLENLYHTSAKDDGPFNVEKN